MTSTSRRILGLVEAHSGLRRLTDAEAERILDRGGEVDAPIEWTVTSTRNGRPVEVRTSVKVVTRSADRLRIDSRIVCERPWQSHWMLIWGDKSHHEYPVNLRRLDLRDDHVNPGGELWQRQTHKHLWSEQRNNRIAYTPDDIPLDPSVPAVGGDDYRGIFEAFAAEVNVTLGHGYVWTDPPLEGLELGTAAMWEVP